MVRDFYPFVENQQGAARTGAPTAPALEVHHPARIAVYDDGAAAPRVVIVEPQDVRPYLEEITQTVSRLAREQGGGIPFMVIREIVENFIHAYFIQPTISILDDGNTIRFSDQGPGIKEKPRALEYGTSSATEEMRQFIRGVGSGLPYVQQYMCDKGGSLSIEDNMAGGTVVTISTFSKEEEETGEVAAATQPVPSVAATPVAYPGYPYPAYPPQAGYFVPGQMPPAHMTAAMAPTQWPATAPAASTAGGPLTGQVSERGMKILSYLKDHESVGPVELARIFGNSQPTWSRELAALDDLGLAGKRKGEQKRRLSAAGRAFLDSLS